MRLFTAKKEKQHRDFDLPETPNDLTWKQAIELVSIEPEDPDGMLKTVAAMTGIESDWWRNTTESSAFIKVAIDCQQFMLFWAKSFDSPESMPLINPILIDGKAITLPDEVGQESTGQYFDALTYQSQWRKKEESEEGLKPVDTFGLYEKIFRIYAYPSITGEPYNAGKAMTMDIDSIPFPAVIGWAYFFLTNQARSKDGRQTNARGVRTQTKNVRQGLSRLRRTLVSWLRSTN